jgi:photosystem II 13kDa protein
MGEWRVSPIPQAYITMTAKMQFVRGIDETVIPDVKLTRSKDGSKGVAVFYFDKPDVLGQDFKEDATGLYMLDEEGEISTKNVNGKFVNGQPAAIEARYEINSPEAWDRFIRFMDRYAAANDLGFKKSE